MNAPCLAVSAILAELVSGEQLSSAGSATLSSIDVRWLQKQGLAALAWQACRTEPCLSANFAVELKAAHYTAVGDAELHRSELLAVLRALNARDVIPVIFKGAALAHTAYADYTVRPMGDLDLWVTADEMPRACAALQELGYNFVEKPNRPLALMKNNSGEVRMEGRRPGMGLVELHWGVFAGEWLRQTANVDEAGVRSRTVPVTLAGQTALTLAPEDGIIQLAVHFAVGHQMAYPWLRGLVDVALSARANAIDWQIIVDRAQAWRVTTAAWLVLKLAIDLTGLDEATWAVKQLSPSPVRRWLIGRFANTRSLIEMRDLTHGPLRFAFLLLLVDRRRDAIRLVWHTLWPDRDWLLARYGRAGLKMQLRHLLDAAQGRI